MSDFVEAVVLSVASCRVAVATMVNETRHQCLLFYLFLVLLVSLSSLFASQNFNTGLQMEPSIQLPFKSFIPLPCSLAEGRGIAWLGFVRKKPHYWLLYNSDCECDRCHEQG